MEWRALAPRLVLAVGLAFFTFALFPESPATEVPIHEVGAVAPDNVIAPFAFTVPKTDAELRREREDVERAAEPVFRSAPAALDTARLLLTQFGRDIAAAASAPGDVANVQAAARTFGVVLQLDEAAYLLSPARRQRMLFSVQRAFDRWLSSGVVASGAVDRLRGEVVLVRGADERRVAVDSLLTFTQLVSRARLINPDPASEVGTEVYLKLLTSFFRPTIVQDHSRTELRRDELRRAVPTVKYTVQAGEKIVGAAEVVGREEHDKLRGLQQALAERRGAEPRIRRAVGAVLFDLVIVLLLGVTIRQFRPRLYAQWRVMVVLAALAAIVVAAAALVSHMRPVRPELIPVTLVAVVASALFDQRISMVITMVVTILIGAQAPFRGTNALFVNLVGGAVAALSVRAVARRHQSYLWLVATGAAYLVAATAIGLMLDQRAAEIVASAGHGALNALASILLALLLLPIAESYTGIETDLTLLEWSDLNRPLMQRLSLEAPGTFAHSMVIANLAEAGCRAIGANALLARVGAYYHDVGKIAKPQYFVENQVKGRNPHDALGPNDSARIIRNHVDEGLALAAQYKVPRVLRAFITEHHGTGQISYFLDKARAGDAAVNEEAFAYPGPVPRSAETAVVMLADGVEAATRVLNDPTPARVREVIDHIVRQRLEQGQLREAPLTLEQVEVVKAQFARILTGMYHSRIDYPRQSGGVTSEFAQA
ncbi:MAG TPA: HDIG domain-containing protein [Gemmatimonadaceae bacterium]|nr:HDIG domain-containing protein [Gemmatimonadaceae bacterium]